MNKIVKKNILIRKIRSSDFDQVYLLWGKAGISVASKEKELYDFQMITKMNPSSCLVFTDNGQIAGVVLGTFNGRRGWIYHLAVDPKYQHKGYGSMLLEEVEKTLKNIGAHKINLGVFLSNSKMISFYKKNGYEIMNDAIYLTKSI